METILSLIQKYKAGDAHASEEICNRMTPLIKKYASKIHCMEFEDAMQELYITLLETLPHLTPSKPEAQCLKYITTAVHNRYRSLCKTYLSIPITENIEDYQFSLTSLPEFDDGYQDICTYIHSLPEKGMQRKIMTLYFFQHKTDTEIAQEVHMSRQYVNRLKKKLISDYFQR